MTMKPSIKSLNRFERAAVNLSWIGSQMPEAHKEIEEEYGAARKALIDHMQRLAEAKSYGLLDSG